MPTDVPALVPLLVPAPDVPVPVPDVPVPDVPVPVPVPVPPVPVRPEVIDPPLLTDAFARMNWAWPPEPDDAVLPDSLARCRHPVATTLFWPN